MYILIVKRVEIYTSISISIKTRLVDHFSKGIDVKVTN